MIWRGSQTFPPGRAPSDWPHGRCCVCSSPAELGRKAGAAPIAAQDSGQPHLPEWPEVTVSLSHDAGMVAAALGRGVPVGVDVQVPVPAPPALLRRCCAPASAPPSTASPSRHGTASSPGSGRSRRHA
nr:hypothetical protein [Salinispora arenicola]